MGNCASPGPVVIPYHATLNHGRDPFQNGVRGGCYDSHGSEHAKLAIYEYERVTRKQLEGNDSQP
ncbi:hypothetical protein A2U01_0059916, partial [Trifolium medium]|nr:hypothetical protein [Trifolium medium]